MNYAAIKYCDIANGEGVRTSLFVSGCTHHCENCFQPETWNFSYGEPFTREVEDEIIESLRPSYVHGLALLGGEPFEPDNQLVLVEFLERLRKECPDKNVWCYTGDLLEDLLDEKSPRHTPVTRRMLECISVLVDGPFVQDLYDITLRFRGSSNQRIIDVPATLAAGEVRPWQDQKIYTTHTME